MHTLTANTIERYGCGCLVVVAAAVAMIHALRWLF